MTVAVRCGRCGVTCDIERFDASGVAPTISELVHAVALIAND